MERRGGNHLHFVMAEESINPALLTLSGHNASDRTQTCQENAAFVSHNDTQPTGGFVLQDPLAPSQPIDEEFVIMQSQDDFDHAALAEEGNYMFGSQLQPIQHQSDQQNPTMFYEPPATTYTAGMPFTNLETSYNLETLDPSQLLVEPCTMPAANLPEATGLPRQAQSAYSGVHTVGFSAHSVPPANSGGHCTGHSITSQREQDYNANVRLKGLWAYDPTAVGRIRKYDTIFIPFNNISLYMSAKDNVTCVEGVQDDIPGKWFTIADNSSCSGVDGLPCESNNTRLLHQWQLDSKHGILITVIRASCDTCRPENMCPTPICVKTAGGNSQHSICNVWASRSVPGSRTRIAFCPVHLASRRQAPDAAYNKRRRGQSSRTDPDLQDNDSAEENQGGTAGFDNVHASSVCGATDPSRNFISHKRLKYLNKQRIQALCRYDPSKVRRIPKSSSVFIPFVYLRLDLDQCDNVTQSATTQGHDSGQEFMIIEGSKCSGLYGSPCGNENTQLLHRWTIDQDHGVLINAIRAACDSCQSQEVYPIPICEITDGSGQRCKAWAPRYKKNNPSRIGHCQMHLDDYNQQQAVQRKKQKTSSSTQSALG